MVPGARQTSRVFPCTTAGRKPGVAPRPCPARGVNCLPSDGVKELRSLLGQSAAGERQKERHEGGFGLRSGRSSAQAVVRTVIEREVAGTVFPPHAELDTSEARLHQFKSIQDQATVLRLRTGSLSPHPAHRHRPMPGGGWGCDTDTGMAGLGLVRAERSGALTRVVSTREPDSTRPVAVRAGPSRSAPPLTAPA